MASQLPTSIGSASALPLATALSVIPSLPRPLLARLVERAIERLDEIDGDSDQEIAWPEWSWRDPERTAHVLTLTEDDEDEHDREGVWFG